MALQTKVTMSRDLKKLISDSPAAFRAARQEVIDIANDMRNYMEIKMRNTPRAPWFYRKGVGRNIIHHPSVPYNFPAIDTGNLVNSLFVDSRLAEVEVGSLLLEPPYPEWLEDGTDKMSPRPFAKPTVDTFRPDMEKRIVSALRRFF